MGLSRQSAPGLVRIPFRTGQIGRRLPLSAITFLFLAAPVALAAQQAEPIASPTQASPPERVDLLAQSREIASENAEGELENCSETDEATLISGEIVVCRRSRDDTATYGFDKKAWEERYAAETRGADPVDVAGPGIFRGAPTIGGLCIPGLQKCPPPPAIVVDFAALPEAPPGSDAERRHARSASPARFCGRGRGRARQSRRIGSTSGAAVRLSDPSSRSSALATQRSGPSCVTMATSTSPPS